jgi:hypothetical protein
MTEQDWSTCNDPARMLTALRGKATPRKLRLLACACCRRLYETRLVDERSGAAVETAERYADDLASKEELVEARQAAAAARETLWRGKRAVWWTTYGRPQAAIRAMLNGAAPPSWRLDSANPRGQRCNARAPLAPRDLAVVCDLFREILGNPFRSTAVDSAWRSWNGGIVAALARAIYDERRFADMPLLADALEEAGCADAAILSHCRSGGAHVRGCWALDLLLGKQ